MKFIEVTTEQKDLIRGLVLANLESKYPGELIYEFDSDFAIEYERIPDVREVIENDCKIYRMIVEDSSDRMKWIELLNTYPKTNPGHRWFCFAHSDIRFLGKPDAYDHLIVESDDELFRLRLHFGL